MIDALGAIDVRLESEVRHWVDDDVSANDRECALELLVRAKSGDIDALTALQDSFSGDLQFGTAGLRGEMAPGPNRMNLSVVTRAAWAIGEYLHGKISAITDGNLNKAPRVVIGYDSRYHSEEFAAQSAEVLCSKGCEVALFDQALPTPLLAFALKELSFDAGIMVTASHNPGKDNGYKVYLGGRVVVDNEQYAGLGAQIISPADKEIAALIASAPSAKEIVADLPHFILGSATELTEKTAQSDAAQSDAAKIANRYTLLEGSQVLEKYYAMALENLPKSGLTNSDFTIVTTAMHGVGGKIQQELLRRSGFNNIYAVSEQEEPNPDFPTVIFPNPEEEGALDKAFELASSEHADLILANDPDADRLAVGCFVLEVGAYRRLTGDEVGVILADYFINKILQTRELVEPGKTGKTGKPDGPDVIASSIVSSRLVAKMCEKNSIQYVTTLTGHKWISRVPRLIFGYEEALGYNIHPDRLRDKDGPATGVLIACIARELKQKGQTLLTKLDEIYAKYGRYTQKQLSIRLPSSVQLTQLVDKFRGELPDRIADLDVISVVDYQEQPPQENLRQNAIEVLLRGGFSDVSSAATGSVNCRIFIRPSGTEPKVKFYLEVQCDDDGYAAKALESIACALEDLSKGGE